MPVDTSIYGNLLKPPKTFDDYANADSQMQINNLNALSLKQKTDSVSQDQAEKASLRAGIGGLDLSTQQGQQGLYKIAPTLAPGVLKTFQDQQTSQALAGKDKAQAGLYAQQAGASSQDQQIKNHTQHLQNLVAVNTPEDALGWITDGIKSGALPADGATAAIKRLQDASQTPQGFAQWKQQTAQSGIGLLDQMKLTDAKPTEMKLGNVVKTIDMNPRSATFGKEVVQAQQMGVSPDTVANNSTSRANNAATIAKDYRVAGLDSNGNFVGAGGAVAQGAPAQGGAGQGAPSAAASASPMQGTIDAVGEYKTPQSVALSRMSQVMKSNVYAEIRKQYPEYDPSQFASRQQATKDFGSGKQGQFIQAGNTALNHIETLKNLAAAQANGDMPAFNKIANSLSAATGQPAPTSVKAAISMVGPEISKAVVTAGGGVSDREHVKSVLDSVANGSPAQAAGTLGTIEDLFGGRLIESARTYKNSTGRDDFTSKLSPAAQKVLSSKQGKGAGSAPAGWSYLGKVGG